MTLVLFFLTYCSTDTYMYIYILNHVLEKQAKSFLTITLEVVKEFP